MNWYDMVFGVLFPVVVIGIATIIAVVTQPQRVPEEDDMDLKNVPKEGNTGIK